MLYAFVFPLVLGVLPLVIISHSKTKKLPGAFSGQLYGCGIFTLTLGSMVKGALDIYGTTSHLSKYYFPVGLVLLLIGAISYLVTIGHHKKSA
ncbi:MAG: hypothetical protein K5669_05420 [Lachnospiraceae bacterium]|nr:hypothetical protein [Lachnospiraceae bacterium]